MRTSLVLPFVSAFVALASAGAPAQGRHFSSQELARRTLASSPPTLNFPTVAGDDEEAWTMGSVPVEQFERQDASGLFARGSERIRSRGFSQKAIKKEIKRLRARTALKRKQGLAKIAAAAALDKKAVSKAAKSPAKKSTPKKSSSARPVTQAAAPKTEVKANVQIKAGGLGVDVGVDVGSSSSSSSSGNGLIGFTSSNCGPSGASASEPNGAESFLSCGVSRSKPSSGWTPPKGIQLSQLKTVSLEEAMASNSVWEPCKPFVSLFEKYANLHGIPPILLAAFALQESTCNPNVLGDSGGAFGLMQITQDKCGGLGASGCSSPDYNIRTAAEYFVSELKASSGEFLVALGSYNGWYTGMSYNDATAMATGGCCECQQNLDYLYQMLNGWILGKTGYTLGSVGNLDSCFK